MKATPNLLFILSDEHQAQALSCAQHPLVKTPNLDRLAARGTRFSNAYTTSPICVPARSSLATGRYPHDIRLWDNAMPYRGDPPSWGHALQDKSVRCESIGKLHYRNEQDPTGFDRQHVPMHVAGGHGMVWASVRREAERMIKTDSIFGDYIGPGDSGYTKYDSQVVQTTKDWISDNAKASEPWCLYVGLVAPHFPLIVPQEFLDLYPASALPPTKLRPSEGYKQHPWIKHLAAAADQELAFKNEDERQMAQRVYFALCSYLDHNVGQILDALETAGLSDDTTIIYASDHGDNNGARGLWNKCTMYEESVSIPMIVAPAKSETRLERGAVCATPTSLVDISETILDNFNATLEGHRPGKSLLEIGSEPDAPDRVVFSEYHAFGAVSGCFMLRSGPWKFIHYEGFEPELFNLKDDPEELENVAQSPENIATLERLRALLNNICDPSQINAQAFADQDALVERVGGKNVALTLGAPRESPAPSV